MSLWPMNVRAEDLLDPERILRGPMVVYWGQEEEEYWRKTEPLSFGDTPKLGLRDRLRRRKLWRFTVRVAPTRDAESLTLFGERVAMRLGQVLGSGADATDTAIWLPGWLFARTAPEAVGSAARVLMALEGIEISQAQVRVEAASVAPCGERG